jgi:hypothetical protein
MADPTHLVPQHLAAASIVPSAEEVETLVAGYPTMKAALDRLHAVPEARYEEPAVIFSAILA